GAAGAGRALVQAEFICATHTFPSLLTPPQPSPPIFTTFHRFPPLCSLELSDLWSSEDHEAIEGLQALVTGAAQSEAINLWSSEDYKAIEGLQALGVHRCKLKEIADATQGFKTPLGEGGYGQVYRGVLKNGEVVAVKRAKGHVKPVLVYEFIERGTLEDMLRANSKHQLTWRQRVNIACGAASGFAYLHHQIKPPIIHRDVKTANILITADLEAKVADFGISKSKRMHASLTPSHPPPPTFLLQTANILITAGLEAKVADFGISKAVPEEAEGGGRLETQVKGTVGYQDPRYFQSDLLTEKSDVYSFGIGYLDPQYFQSDLLTEKSDVYSFGIVLLELATGLRPGGAVGGGAGGGAGGGRGGGEGGTEGGGEGRGGGGGGKVGMSEGKAMEETCGSEALEETFEWFVRLAMRCSLKQVQNRPDMQQVLKELEGIKRRLNWVSASRAAGAGDAGGFAAPGGAAATGVADVGGGDSDTRENGEGYNMEGEPVCASKSQTSDRFWKEIAAAASGGAAREDWGEEDEDEEVSWYEERMKLQGGKGGTSSSGGDGLSPTMTFSGSVHKRDVNPR
ncbi:unnamed protein product, partial [Closterium sp. NIES-65]